MPGRRKPYTRIRNPQKLVPTAATTRLLLGIYYHEGMLSQRQLVPEFFPGKTKSWPEHRLQHYFDHFLLNKYNAEWVNGEHLKETIYTLGTLGAKYLARYLELDYTSFTYRPKPRWLTLSHDLKLNDFRFSVTREAKSLRGFELVRWVSEFELQQNYQIPGRPDGFFLLRRPSPTSGNTTEELAILVELDNATHPLKRFVTRKVKPALKFIGSKEYQRIFGIDSGAYFVVTTGPKRLANLKAQTESSGGAGRFFFATMDQVGEGVLTNPIWEMAGSDERLAISSMPLKPRLGVQHHTTKRRLSSPVFAV